MKQSMLSKKNSSYLFDHVLDGFRSSYEGIEQLKQQHLISEDEYVDLLKKNSSRLIDRIKEFKVHMKLVSLFFAVQFAMLQVNGDDLDMRRTSRTRTSSSRSARGSRRNDSKFKIQSL